MASLIDKLHQYLDEHQDERTGHWPLIDSPIPLTLISIAYVLIVKKIGPAYMRDKKPFNLNLVISFYNVGQIAACAWIFYGLFTVWSTENYKVLGCQNTDRSRSPGAMKLAGLCWYTLLLKLSEYTETVFFVMRKKNNQVTFLHLYHHIVTLMFAWSVTKYEPGGLTGFAIMANCLVHILMYTYYLTSLHAGPALKKTLATKKKYITIVQMIQFCLIIPQVAQAMMPDCTIHKPIAGAFVLNICFVFYLFYSFYDNAFLKKTSHKTS